MVYTVGLTTRTSIAAHSLEAVSIVFEQQPHRLIIATDLWHYYDLIERYINHRSMISYIHQFCLFLLSDL